MSVFMPVYNGAEHLAETIESVLAQTLADFELVVVDDGSTDESWAVLEVFAESDPRVRPHRLDVNQGHHAASNTAISRCRGEFLLRIDQDDLATPTRLERTVEAFDAHPDVGMVYSWYVRWLPDGTRIERQPPGTDTALRVHEMFHNTVCHATLAFRRSVLDVLVEPYRPVGGPQDYDLIVRALEHTSSYCVPEPLAVYRQSTMAMTEMYGDTMEAAVEEISDAQLDRYLPVTEVPAVRRSFNLEPGAGEYGAVSGLHRLLVSLPAGDPRFDAAEVTAIRRGWTRRALRSIGAGRLTRDPRLVWSIIRSDPRGVGTWLRSEVAARAPGGGGQQSHALDSPSGDSVTR